MGRSVLAIDGSVVYDCILVGGFFIHSSRRCMAGCYHSLVVVLMRLKLIHL
jgi:hypothetical protein